MSGRHINSGRRQRGVATLAISLILLFLVTIVTLYTANTSVLEQKISANQYRSDQAFSAANAALDYGIAIYDRDGDASLGTPDTALAIEYANANQNAFWSIGNTAPPLVSGQGTSDDGTASRIMSVRLGNINSGGSGPKLPLISHGTVGLSGNFSITNTWNDDSVWSGGPTDIGNSTSATTNLRDPADTNPDDGWDTKVSSSNDVGNGADVIDNDPNLAALTDDQFFEHFLGADRDTLYTLANDIDQAWSADALPDLDGKTGIIWIEGDVNISSNANIGTSSDPVIMVLNGNVRTTGTLNITGLVYCVETWDFGGGTVNITGAVVVEDNSANSVTGNGTLDIVFDPNVLGRDGPVGGATGIIPGTWRDW